MAKESKIYKAYRKSKSGRLMGIISVIASSDCEARKEVLHQLDRPGRRGYLEVWERDGEIVEPVDL